MKLLVVLVSALVLVAHCNVLPEDDGAYLAEHEPEEYKAIAVEIVAAEDAEEAAVASVDLPVDTRSCTAATCTQLCRRLGYNRGVCISSNVCRCSN